MTGSWRFGIVETLRCVKGTWVSADRSAKDARCVARVDQCALSLTKNPGFDPTSPHELYLETSCGFVR